MLESLKRILDKLSNFDLVSWLSDITVSGYKIGLGAAQKDLKKEDSFEPDMESIVRIGLRAHALSDKALAKAKGGMAHNADKLYQEMDAAMKAGMSEKEALFQIQGRVRGLFSEAYQEWELERLVRDQFLVATKEGRRAGWQEGGIKYRQWKIHLDNKTAADSKRMEGQITEIDKPYTDPLTGEKYMLAHIRPNDRCFSVGLWELPEDTVERDGLIYAKNVSSDFIKGGVGSGIKGHRTVKEQKSKLYKVVEDFENKYRNRKMENGLLLDSNGNILLAKKGTKDRINYTEKEASDFLFSKKGYLLTHNHPNDAALSLADLNLMWQAGLTEMRAVGATNTFILRFKKEVPKKVYFDMMYKIKYYQDRFYYKFDALTIEGKMKAYDATIAYSNEAMESFVKEFPEYIHYQKITTVEKGGVGSGIKGHTTAREQMPKVYKVVDEFEAKYRNRKAENGLLLDSDGNILLAKKGTKTGIKYTREEELEFFLSKKAYLFTHNHPTDAALSPADIKASWLSGIIETRAVGPTNTFILRFKKEIPEEVWGTMDATLKHDQEVFYRIYKRKVMNDEMDAKEADIAYADKAMEKFVNDFSEYLDYKKETIVQKGGEGSGVRGHRTYRNNFKQKYLKGLQEIQKFEKKVRNSRLEFGCLVNTEGNIVLTTQIADSPDQVSFSSKETEMFKEGAENHTNLIFSHNHPNGASFSDQDILTAMNFDLKEVRAVGKDYIYSLKFKHPISKNDEEKISVDINYFREQIRVKYLSEMQKRIISAHKASLLWSNEWVSKLAKEHPKVLEYTRTANIEKTFNKGGPGSGVKGHRTEKKEIPKYMRGILDFEDGVRGRKLEQGLVVDERGNVLIHNQGIEDRIQFTERDWEVCMEKAKVGKIFFTHNHPTSSSFSIEDIVMANHFKFSEVRIAGKEHDYSMKISKVLDKNEILASHRKWNSHYYNKFNDLVCEEKLDRHKAWMTHTHLIWKHVAKEIDGLDYKRIR